MIHAFASFVPPADADLVMDGPPLIDINLKKGSLKGDRVLAYLAVSPTA